MLQFSQKFASILEEIKKYLELDGHFYLYSSNKVQIRNKFILHRQLSFQELKLLIQLPKSSLSRELSQLVSMQIIQRKKDTKDSRISLYQLHPATDFSGNPLKLSSYKNQIQSLKFISEIYLAPALHSSSSIFSKKIFLHQLQEIILNELINFHLNPGNIQHQRFLPKKYQKLEDSILEKYSSKIDDLLFESRIHTEPLYSPEFEAIEKKIFEDYMYLPKQEQFSQKLLQIDSYFNTRKICSLTGLYDLTGFSKNQISRILKHMITTKQIQKLHNLKSSSGRILYYQPNYIDKRIAYEISACNSRLKYLKKFLFIKRDLIEKSANWSHLAGYDRIYMLIDSFLSNHLSLFQTRLKNIKNFEAKYYQKEEVALSQKNFFKNQPYSIVNSLSFTKEDLFLPK